MIKQSETGVFPSVSLLPITALVLMLCFPSLSVTGAADGLNLWFQVVLPTLAPFMICTQAIAAFGGMEVLMKPFYPLIHSLFGLSLPGSYILLCGILCGYPLGARLCADFVKSGKITGEEAQYLFAVCNHPSPMFLMGYVRGQMAVNLSPICLILWLYLPILPISGAAARYYHYQRSGSSDKQLSAAGMPAANESAANRSLEDILMSTSETMVMIGGYMMLFSILSSWVRRIPGMPARMQAIITGVAEITTGVHQICGSFPAEEAVLPCMAVIALGGFSGIFQTKGVIKNAGLSIRHYVGWKAVHACLSGILVLLFF